MLVTRVHGWVTDELAQQRFTHIRNFEAMLSDEGTTLLKFFLHIDKEEQKKRLLARQADPEKNWKLTPSDISERKHWDTYLKFYQEAIEATSTPNSPWYIIPANHKKRRDLVLATIVRKHLEDLDPHPPLAEFDVSKLVIE